MNILSLDGGGIRGVLTARLLQRLDRACPGFLDHVDVIAGTSTGGIQALFLANGGKVEQLTDLYVERGRDIFRPRDWVDSIPKKVLFSILLGGLIAAGALAFMDHHYFATIALITASALVFGLRLLSRLDELGRANYSAEHLEGVLKDVLGEVATVRDLKKIVVIPTFDMRDWNTKFFDNFPGDMRDLDQKLWEVARCTSAAPTYWPSHQWCLDGGLFANNPSDSAVASVVRYLKRKAVAAGTDPDTAMFEALKKISVLSLGTGDVPRKPPSDDPKFDGGVLHMIPMLLNVVMEGGVKASTFRTAQVLNGRHVRVNPKLPSTIDLADVDAVDELVQVADLADLDEAVQLIRSRWIKAVA